MQVSSSIIVGCTAAVHLNVTGLPGYHIQAARGLQQACFGNLTSAGSTNTWCNAARACSKVLSASLPGFARASPVCGTMYQCSIWDLADAEACLPYLMHSGLASGAMLLCKLLNTPVAPGLGSLATF